MRIGSKVRCVDNFDSSGNLTAGKIYTITGIEGGYYRVIADNGEEGGYFSYRFILLDDTKVRKLSRVRLPEYL